MCTCWYFVPHSQVLQLHADSTSASVSWADYSHGALSGSAAPPHSPVCGQQGPEFGDGDAADSPGSMSAMLTWAGAGMKQLASKLLGSSSLTDSQQVQPSMPLGFLLRLYVYQYTMNILRFSICHYTHNMG